MSVSRPDPIVALKKKDSMKGHYIMESYFSVRVFLLQKMPLYCLLRNFYHWIRKQVYILTFSTYVPPEKLGLLPSRKPEN